MEECLGCGHDIELHRHYTNHTMCSKRVGGSIDYPEYCPCTGPKTRKFLWFKW
jgi:hypothetical protein